MARLRVAVVQGGPSSEGAVSRSSARGVEGALRSSGHDVVRLELDAYLGETLRGGGYDVVFPVAHGAVGEDGSLQGLLEVLELPYVGSGVLASAMAMHKGVARQVFASQGLPLARGEVVTAVPGSPLELARRLREAVGQRLVVKPVAGGSAIGVTRVSEEEADDTLARALLAAWSLGEGALVEWFARGREVTCGVSEIGGGAAWAFPPTEVLADKDAFYTYQARYAPGRSRHLCPAPLPKPVLERVQAVSVAAHLALGCRDLSRVDFVVGDNGDDEAVFLLEVNTMPGFTPTSLYPEAAAVAGLTFPALCDALVHRARDRGPTRRNAVVPLPGP